jgi:citrate synthase
MTALVDAATAAQRLNVSRATLYAYVSRGFIRAHAEGNDPRRRLYSADDVERLVVKKARGRKPDRIAETTLDFGLPVLSSRITLIADGRLFYRGRDAVRLAETASLEEVAALLWECSEGVFDTSVSSSPAFRKVSSMTKAAALTAALSPLERCLALVSFMDFGGLTTWQRDRARLLMSAADLLRQMAAAAAGTVAGRRPIHETIASAWGLGLRQAELLRKVLVLFADHELNASTFAVRVVASTGASLGACVAGGLAALSGPRHGGATRRVEAMCEEIERVGDAERVVADRLGRGELLPGCGHPLYRDGDPRAVAMLADLPETPFSRGLLAAIARNGAPAPNCDLAVVLLTRALKLPAGTASALFAIGRTAGWIAHALEQVSEGRLIRPRARYIGVAPEH